MAFYFHLKPCGYFVLEWNPEESGCYRPYLYDSTKTKEVENSLVTTVNPVMVVVSDTTYDINNQGYDAGLYCKWLIHGDEDVNLAIDFIDVNIHPISKGCTHDGFVVLLANETNPQYGKNLAQLRYYDKFLAPNLPTHILRKSKKRVLLSL